MTNVKWVQLTHGSQELGKDIVFRTEGGFGESLLCACVVKNFKITGAVDDNKGAMTVIHQVNQALKQPFVGADGNHEKVSKVYVMCPHELPQPTIKSIEGELRERFGQVEFICGQKLLMVFEKYYPEYLLLRSGLLTSYVSSLRLAFEEEGPLRHLSFKHGMLASAKQRTSRAYVRQAFRIEVRDILFSKVPVPISLDLGKGMTANQVGSLEEYLNRIASFLRTYLECRASQATEIKGAKQLLTRIVSLRKRLRKDWEREFTAYLRRSGTTEENRRHKRQEVSLAPSDADDLSAVVVSIVKKFAETRLEIVKRAKQFTARVSSHSTSASAFFSEPDYLEYCTYRELNRQFPRMLAVGKTIGVIDYSENILDEFAGPFLVTGPPGYGKTSFCKWSALHDGELYAKAESNVIPVYVPLYRLAESGLESFESSFLGQDNVPQILHSQELTKKSKIRLYLDGLDEIPLEEQKRVVDLAIEGVRRHPHVQLVITGREHVMGAWLCQLPRIRIAEFDEEKMRELVFQLLDRSESATSEFCRQLELMPNLRELNRVPLLVTLTACVYSGLTTLPEGKTELYRIFVDLMCGGWDAAKGVKRPSQFKAVAKLRLLIHLAANLQFSRMREATDSVLKEAIKSTALPYLKEWEVLAADMVQDGLLVRDGDTYTFCHHSFQEYLCARDMADPSTDEDDRLDVIRRYLRGDDWWREVVNFYLALSYRPEQIEHLLNRLSSENKSNKTLPQSERFSDERMKFLKKAIEQASGWSRAK